MSFESPEDMEVTMRAYWAEGSQIHVHTNGDLAMQVPWLLEVSVGCCFERTSQ